MGAYDKFYVFISIVLMIAFYGAIPLGILIEPELFSIMSVWMLYLVLSIFTGTCSYINNVVRLPLVYENIKAAIMSPPSMYMRI